jgi:hypothetical protein
MSELTIEAAFLDGLARVRAAGIPASGKDVAVLAAHRVFLGDCLGKDGDPRFAEHGPRHAMNLILMAYSRGG